MSALGQAECGRCGRAMTCSPAGGLAEVPVCSLRCAQHYAHNKLLDETYAAIRKVDAMLDPSRIKGVL